MSFLPTADPSPSEPASAASPLVRDLRPEEYARAGDLLVEIYRDAGATGEYLEVLRDAAGRADFPATEQLVAVDRASGELLGACVLTYPGSPMRDDPADADHAHADHAGAGRGSDADHAQAGRGSGAAGTGTAGETGLRMLGVSSTARRRGIAAALVGECVARTRLAGCAALSLGTMESMRAAQRLYDRLGFRRTPDRDEIMRSGRRLITYTLPTEPWPLVREARPEEYAEIGELTARAYTSDGLLDPDDDYLDRLRDAQDRAEKAELLVAVDRVSGALLGTVTVCPDGSPYREIAEPDEGEFRMLGVAPSARGRGVGESLTRAVMARLRAQGRRRVAMSSGRAMVTAHRLYRRLGFERIEARDWNPLPEVALLVFGRDL